PHRRDRERRIAARQSTPARAPPRRPLDVRTVDGANVIATRIEGLDDEGVRAAADRLREQYKPGVVLVGSAAPQGALLVAAVSKDLTPRFHAGKIIKELAPIVGGGGGGRPDFAQAGGKDPSRLADALARFYPLGGAQGP